MSTPGPVRLLCAGDLHLGRFPSRLPENCRVLSVDHVWQQLTQTAIERKVDAVVLTGDVVDEDNKVFEALRALERGVRKLAREGVGVVAVAGNHDFDALPRLRRNLGEASFRVLGQGGSWESYTLRRDGAPVVRLVGWSFPQEHVHRTPLDSFAAEPADVPTIGVMHCDLDQPNSPYAPVESRRLGRTGVEGWLLGHIHQKCRAYEGDQLHLYPGSLQPLHPNERGVHGAWLVEVGGGGSIEAELLPLATLRYGRVPVQVDDCESIEEVEATTSAAIRERLQEAEGEMPELRHAVLRPVFTGRTGLTREISDWAPGYADEFETSYARAQTSLDGFVFDLKPDRDLEALSSSQDAAGELAALLLELERGTGGADTRALLRRVRAALDQVHAAPGYEPLQRDPATDADPDDEALRQMTLRQGRLLLDELLAAQEVNARG